MAACATAATAAAAGAGAKGVVVAATAAALAGAAGVTATLSASAGLRDGAAAPELSDRRGVDPATGPWGQVGVNVISRLGQGPPWGVLLGLLGVAAAGGCCWGARTTMGLDRHFAAAGSEAAVAASMMCMSATVRTLLPLLPDRQTDGSRCTAMGSPASVAGRGIGA